MGRGFSDVARPPASDPSQTVQDEEAIQREEALGAGPEAAVTEEWKRS
jgi:hypothetical protein